MNNFLITYTLVQSFYMEDFTKNQHETKTAMVEAEDEKLAVKTLEKYWENQSCPYSVTYNVRNYDVALSLRQTEILSDEKKK